MPRNYWMVVTSLENHRITCRNDFSVQGFRESYRKRVERMEVGDRMLFYLSPEQRFSASATVTSTFFIDHTEIWVPRSAQEMYPYRVHIEPVALLQEEEFLDAREIGPRMEYVKKWTPELWPLAFFGDLHLIPKKDFALIEDEMKKAESFKKAAQRRQSRRGGEEAKAS